MNVKDMTGPSVAVALAAVLISAGMVYILLSGDDIKNPREMVELGPFTQRMTSLTRTSVSESGNLTPDEIGGLVQNRLNGWVDISKHLVPGYSVTLDSSEVEVMTVLLSAGIPLPASTIESDKGTITPNSMLFGTAGPAPIVPSLRTDVRLDLDLVPDGGGDKEDVHVSYMIETIDPERALNELIDMMERDINGWYGGMSRDVEYILNALVRLRAKNGIGTGFSDTNLHLLNDGDVELAVNFALAITMARWTGSIPDSLVSSIDAYFSEQDPLSQMNPTGARPWGQAEKENFNGYIVRSRNEPLRRTTSDLMTTITTFSHADPADLFLRYLYMDRTTGSGGTKEALDLISPLVEDKTLNPRQTYDSDDPFSLEYHPFFPSSEGIEVQSGSDLMGNEKTSISIDPALDTEYLVIGRDIHVGGVHSFKAWYTNANLSFDDSNLIAYGNGTQVNQPVITRCGAIPPPPEPPWHDYRVQWDLDIEGTFMVDATSSGWSGNTYDPSSTSRTLDLSFPVRIYTGTGRIYSEGFEGIFNINTGSQFYTPLSTGWVITPRANATEYFESRAWQELRAGFEPLTSLSRTAGWMETALDPVQARLSIHSASMGAISSLLPWISSTDVQIKLNDLYKNNIKLPGMDPAKIGTIRIDGHEIGLSYSPARDRMGITSILPEGTITLRIWPVSGGPVRSDAEILLSSGTRIELDITDGTFSLHGTFGGAEVNEGSGILRPPDDAVWEMMGKGDSIYSPGITIDLKVPIQPYMTEKKITSEEEITATLWVFLRGDTDMLQVKDMLPPGGTDLLSLIRTAVRATEKHSLSIGISAVMDIDGSQDIERSIVFRSLTDEDLDLMEERGLIDQMVIDIISSSRIEVMDLPGEEMLITESTPSWTVHLPEGAQGTMLTTVVHVLPGEVPQTSYFTSSMAILPGSSWTVVSEKVPSPLW